MFDPRDPASIEGPVDAREQFSTGPLPEAFVQHYAAGFMTYWGMTVEPAGNPGPVDPDLTAQ